MSGIRGVASRIAAFFGLHKNSKYVNEYIHNANIRSGISLAGVVIILEIWLIIRQHFKYIGPQLASGENYVGALFKNTSLFWLMLIMSLTMGIYCFYYLSKNKTKQKLTLMLGVAAIGFVLCCLLPFEKNIINFEPEKLTETILLIAFYASIALFQILVAIASVLMWKGKQLHWLSSIMVISVYAGCLLLFGVRVSYKDFFSSVEEKQIICFLTMGVYVACLLVWKPYVSVPVLGVIFLGFYFLLKSNESARALPEGDEVNYITFFISLAMTSVSIHTQRSMEARKDEELELLATKDPLTGLYSFEYFITLCKEKAANDKIAPFDWVYLFVDITAFSLYNEQRGFQKGNEFLCKVASILKEEFPEALVCRQNDDNFVLFAANRELEERLDIVKKRVETLDADIRPSIKAGGYPFKDKDADPHGSVERARVAFAAVKNRPGEDYLFYNDKLREKTMLIRYIISHLDEAIEQGWIKAYYQPVVYAADRTLCGAEALTRWIDPKYGFMAPGLFIGTLENAQLAYKLDLAMLEIVCKNMAEAKQKGEVIVPVSINFSRADFSIINVPTEVKRIVDKYGVDPKNIHVEITESALLGVNADLKSAMDTLREYGFEIWLDDFGSGYSSFNALKDYSFDVLKLDMEFLKGFETNQKSKPLIDSVIHMSQRIGMATLAEGVETEEQAEFLHSIGCGKLQGYLVSKPIPYEEFKQSIADGKFTLSETLKA